MYRTCNPRQVRVCTAESATSCRPAGLTLVATPIGNLGDVSHRAVEVLGAVDLVLCEDTRVTRRLMAAYGLETPLASYHDHNAARVRPRILERLATGECIALVSDAGTPAISDPGFRLVRACRDAGISVSIVPGPTALIAALAISGLPTDSFYFGGFPPPRRAARRACLASLAGLQATLVFHESARRLQALLADAELELAGRQVVVARELTKVYEEVREGSIAELLAHYRDAGPPRGEVVVLFGPPAPVGIGDAEIDELLRSALRDGTLRDAVRSVVEATGAARARVYRRAIELQETSSQTGGSTG